MLRSTRQSIFFTLMFLLFYLVIKLSQYWLANIKANPELILIMIGAVYTLTMIAVFYLSDLATAEPYKEKFWDVDVAAQCKGGPFFWQTDDDPLAKKCRELASTTQGQCALDSFNCPVGFNGTPRLPFEYTPLSNDRYQNERCDGTPSCSCTRTHLRY